MLDSNDVLLVTGGGKGIAAECAFALAQETGVTLALLGRSHPQYDPILAEHLTKLEIAGIHYHYVSIDVQDALGVAQAIHEIEARLGPITAILHGAGVNDPALLSTLNEETFKKTLAPKVRGLENILSAISPQRIKYLIAFGSIIARTGMQGEAHYALANEWLGHITEAFQRAYPACFCLCIEWSVWSGVGMGERLGRVEALRAEGIMPIPVEAGIALFRQLLSQRQTTARIVVSGRFSTVPTLKMATWQLPFLRFLEKPLIFYPGVELVVDVEMSTTTDLYLNDHQLEDERLVPAVIGLEAMAQIAMAVTGKQVRPSFTDVRFVRPLVIPEQRSVTLRMMALVQHDGSVEVAIRCSETTYQTNHFQAVCHFSQQCVEQRSLQWPASGETIVQLQLPDDLYGQLLFHRGRFQRILRYTYLHARECIAEIAPYTSGAWFARYLPSEFILGDPASRDAIIHAIQACIPQATLLPVRVESLSFAEQPFVPGEKIRVYARERERQGDSFIYDVEARNSDGQLLEQWSGLHLQLVGALLPHKRWAEVLLGPYFERRIPEFYPQMQLYLALHRAANASLTVNLNNSDQESVRIDIVVPRSKDDWNNILNAQQYELAEQLAEESLEDFDSAATRVLAASEVLKKVALPLDISLVLVKTEHDGWQILEAGPYVLLTFVTHVRSQLQPLAFIFCHQSMTDVERLNLVVDAQRG
ncbi:hypothetical protein KSF_011250 [Reticulibacter mediterranei]|uniref:PKS/mFAS DH domain-containing protein n=1 Tax=Reticulibacter mediterranei TaxID=2778369 RepID=A0A8J3IGH7_9CHLR|nr:SDR family oxidoreductase [Reticulibacter mediterranei]GHO91077.1 hypothetical protein KSF_011250 [Reticulibacter mediterranei]